MADFKKIDVWVSREDYVKIMKKTGGKNPAIHVEKLVAADLAGTKKEPVEKKTAKKGKGAK